MDEIYIMLQLHREVLEYSQREHDRAGLYTGNSIEYLYEATREKK